jgi:hypothetical protein
MYTSNLDQGGTFSTMVYRVFPTCRYHHPTMTITFRQPVSQITMLVGVNAYSYALTVRDDKGGYIRLPKDSGLLDEIVSLPSTNIRQVTITVDRWLPDYSGHSFYIDDIQFAFGSGATSTISVFDPVPELLTDSGSIVTSPEILATSGLPVLALAADRATRVVVRMGANRAGENLRLSILNDQGLPSTSIQEDGRLGTVDGQAEPGQSVLNLTAVSTSRGPMAFALYRPPPDFSRAGRDDNGGIDDSH